MTLAQFFDVLFPYRKLIREELDYLRAQLSQKQRRVDELQEALIEIAKPKPIAARAPEPVKPHAMTRGWEALRRKMTAERGDIVPLPVVNDANITCSQPVWPEPFQTNTLPTESRI